MSQNPITLDRPQPEPSSLWWRVVKFLLGALAIGLFVYYLRLYVDAPERLGAVCSSIEAGMSQTDVHVFATARGLRPPPPDQEVTYLGEVATNGRHGCRVEWQGGRVARSVYEHAK